MLSKTLLSLCRATALLFLFCLPAASAAASEHSAQFLAMGKSGDENFVRAGEDASRAVPAFGQRDAQTETPQDARQDVQPKGTAGQRQAPPADDRPLAEQIFGGSVFGSVVFGYPMRGLGMPDILIVAFIAYVVLKAVFNRRERRGDSAFEADRHSPGGNGSSGGRDKTGGSGRGVAWPDKDRDASGEKDENALSRPGGDKKRAFGTDAWNPEARDSESSEIPPKWGAASKGRRPTTKEQAALMWEHLQGGSGTAASSPASVERGARVPGDFDVNGFLEGARMLYARLQTSWAARDVDDLAPFTTPEMMGILRAQALQDPRPAYVEVILVNASLADVERSGDEERASVSFSALLRHAPGEDPAEARELWHFARNAKSGGTWRLDGIGQAG